MKVLAVLLVLACLTSCTMEIGRPANQGNVYIVSVGLDYSNSSVSSLSGTVADACEFCLSLNEIYASKKVPCTSYLMIQEGSLIDEENYLYPTENNVKQILETLDTNPDDLIVFYFSGHGDVEDDRALMATAKSSDGQEYTKLFMDDVYDILSEKACRSAVLIDSCFSGFMTKNGLTERSFSEAMKNMFATRKANNISIMASCQYNQISLVSTVFTEEGLIESHSLFTASILDCLGWGHSKLERTMFDNHQVFGYQKYIPSNVSMNELYKKTMSSWVVQSQIPEINRTDVSVKIIP